VIIAHTGPWAREGERARQRTEIPVTGAVATGWCFWGGECSPFWSCGRNTLHLYKGMCMDFGCDYPLHSMVESVILAPSSIVTFAA